MNKNKLELTVIIGLTVVLFAFPTNAYASDCSDMNDCYHSILLALLALLAIVAIIALIAFVLPALLEVGGVAIAAEGEYTWELLEGLSELSEAGYGGVGDAVEATEAVEAGEATEAGEIVRPQAPQVPTDPAEPPGDGWDWRGKDIPGGNKGSWYNPETGESLHPDLSHPEPIGPHWNYIAPDGSEWRIFPDGSIEPK